MESKTATLVAVLCALACVNVVFSSDNETCLSSKQAVKNFEYDKWSGHWYLVRSTPYMYGYGGKCVQNFYSPLSEGRFKITAAISITNTMGTTKINYGTSVAKIASFTNEGKFNITLKPRILSGEENSYGEPFYILGTDYTNYSVVYGCKTIMSQDYDFISILSRTPQLDEQFQRTVDEILVEQNLDPSPLETIVQDCGNLLR